MKVIMLIYFLLAFLSIFSIWGVQNQKISIGIPPYFSIDFNILTAAVTIVLASVAAAVIATIQVGASGLSGESGVMIFKAIAFLAPYAFLMLVNQPFFNMVPYGTIFEGFLTLFFVGAIGENLYSSGG